LETCRDLERKGVEIIYLPVNRQGLVDLKKLKDSLNERTILVSIICASNEIGTIQPITEISDIIRNFKNSKLQTPNSKKIQNSNNKNSKNWDLGFGIWDLPAVYPLVHTDAVQAFQFLDCDVNKLGVDLMTLSAHKIYGLKGIGALYINSKLQAPNYKQITNSKNQIKNKKNWNLEFGIWNLPAVKPLVTGGGQEFGLRSGTENVAGIVGFAKAAELAVKNREKEAKRIAELSNYFWRELKKIEPKAKINGIDLKDLRFTIYDLRRLPNILNIYFPGQNAQDLLMKLDLNGIAISSGAACSARSLKPSYVLEAIGLSEKRAKSSLRFSFGKFTTKEEINYTVKMLKRCLN
jgi:cysteine desulfurase